jgi:tRNA (cytidine/uridine-2'-O-)-methyltransferase
MDYFDQVQYTRHADWAAFQASVDSRKARIILLSSKAERPHYRFAYRDNDILLFGSEGSGVPLTIREQCDAAITIPMKPGMRSLNLAVSAGMALGEALRQTGQFPE